jgi:hypothetical protein
MTITSAIEDREKMLALGAFWGRRQDELKAARLTHPHKGTEITVEIGQFSGEEGEEGYDEEGCLIAEIGTDFEIHETDKIMQAAPHSPAVPTGIWRVTEIGDGFIVLRGV